MGFRVVIDVDLCQGHGVCEMEAPDLFEVGRDHKVRLLEERPGEDQRRGAEAAVKYCPTHALKIEED